MQSADGPRHHLADIDAAISKGRLLAAYDLATAAIALDPHNVALRHRAVLALARAGLTDLAEARYQEWALAGARPADRRLRIDLAALQARLMKDRALKSAGGERLDLLKKAAGAYGAIFEETGDSYVGVNAATLHLWAGDVPTAKRLAERALPLVAGADYYAEATRAEALLVLGDCAGAAAALARAAATEADFQKWSVTRRQLQRGCALVGCEPSLLAVIDPPAFIHFLGHMPGKRFDAADEDKVARTIAAEIERLGVRFGYGALAAGADILFAEALIAGGAELHVVLPFDAEDFCRVSVKPAGERWAARYRACMEAAASVRLATDDLYLGDDSLFSYATRYAMGLALQHAAFLGAGVQQIAVWDQEPSGGPGGTGDDVSFWRRLAHPQIVISPRGDTVHAPRIYHSPDPPSERGSRQIRGVLFGDVSGFSGLRESQVPLFTAYALKRVADALKPLADRILVRNTWGDGIFLVLEDAEATAEAAMSVQSAWATLDFGALGLPPDLGLRLGVSVGPVRRIRDPITGRTNFVGAHVSQVARIEPVVPPGMTFATEAFAVALMLDREARFACDYMGAIELAKQAGSRPLYRLCRAGD